MQEIKSIAIDIIAQLKNLADQLSDDEFSSDLPVLLNNSIGKHYRHIIEFFMILLSESESGSINYDRREHDPELEQDRLKCISRLNSILADLPDWIPEKEIEFNASYSLENEELIRITTNLQREYIYNIEHAIHHMAIIRIAVEHDFPGLALPQYFGFAYSTIKHRDS